MHLYMLGHRSGQRADTSAIKRLLTWRWTPNGKSQVWMALAAGFRKVMVLGVQDKWGYQHFSLREG